MSNKIDLTGLNGVTFQKNLKKMDVFLINGAPISMSSRPPTNLGKPAIFHKPKPPVKLKPIKKPTKPKKTTKKKMQNVNKQPEIEPDESRVFVKMPSVESDDDYKSPTTSTSPGSTSTSSSSDEDEIQSAPEDEVDDDSSSDKDHFRHVDPYPASRSRALKVSKFKFAHLKDL